MCSRDCSSNRITRLDRSLDQAEDEGQPVADIPNADRGNRQDKQQAKPTIPWLFLRARRLVLILPDPIISSHLR